MHAIFRRLKTGGVVVGMAMTAATATAATNTFTGTGGWTDAARWSPAPPVNGDTVIVDGTCSNTASTEILDSYTLNASRTHTFYGTNSFLRATNITINGTLTHGTNTATSAIGGVWYPDNLAWIIAYSNFTLATGGQIDVDRKGYGGTLTNGCGPGGGVPNGGGAGYGGMGGGKQPLPVPLYAFDYPSRGATYGVSNAPVDPGSAGGGYSVNNYYGGAGGGAVRIQAGGLVTINGLITANGGRSWGLVYTGGGSGGSVFIECSAFTGNGLILANGGQGYTAGQGADGGGGRIAVIVTNAAAQAAQTPAVQFQALTKPYSSPEIGPAAQLGTLYFNDASFFPYTNMMGGYRLCIPGFTNWGVSSFTVSNAPIQFPDGFQLRVTNTLQVQGYFSGDGWIVYGGIMLSDGNLRCDRNLILTNGGRLYVYSGPTNAGGADYGNLISVGDMRVTSNSVCYLYSHPTNGGSVLLQVGNLTIATNGQINANGLGYSITSNDAAGYGPGGGIQPNGAGGYGGRGGGGANGGLTYGSSNAPLDPGSAGSRYRAGAGGGLVRIEALKGNVTVDGAISANGGDALGSGNGGSGGGVFIQCRRFQGAGAVTAKGGQGADYQSGGGGGRVAIWRMYDQWQGLPFSPITNVVVGAAGGHAGVTSTGEVGTVYFQLIPPCGSVFSFH